jgi:hypothetical protein
VVGWPKAGGLQRVGRGGIEPHIPSSPRAVREVFLAGSGRTEDNTVRAGSEDKAATGDLQAGREV